MADAKMLWGCELRRWVTQGRRRDLRFVEAEE